MFSRCVDPSLPLAAEGTGAAARGPAFADVRQIHHLLTVLRHLTGYDPSKPRGPIPSGPRRENACILLETPARAKRKGLCLSRTFLAISARDDIACSAERAGLCFSRRHGRLEDA